MRRFLRRWLLRALSPVERTESSHQPPRVVYMKTYREVEETYPSLHDATLLRVLEEQVSGMYVNAVVQALQQGNVRDYLALVRAFGAHSELLDAMTQRANELDDDDEDDEDDEGDEVGSGDRPRSGALTHPDVPNRERGGSGTLSGA